MRTRRTGGASRHAGATPPTASGPTLSIADFSVGDKVAHDEYGLGTVVGLEDKGRNSVIAVDFGSGGTKRLMLRVAPIEKL